jgi:iron(II)-dependent oxidoreductase
VTIGGGAYLALLCVPSTSLPSPQLTAFVAQMAQLSATPLSALSSATPVLPQTMQQHAPSSTPGPLPGMLKIAGGSYEFYATGREIEGQHRPGVDFQYPWESGPQLRHRHTFQLADYYIDKHPVTNAQYKQFVDASGYAPADGANYLRDWRNGSYAPGWADRPVTWLALDDAAAYCRHVGARLPNEWEWQYAAQGNDGRLYPWGSNW